MKNRKYTFWIKLPYWLGIFADALWAVALFFPSIFATFIGRNEYEPDLQTRLIMGIGGILMTGWTILLIWAVIKPVERRFVILLTALLVAGFGSIALIGAINGNSLNTWILVKTTILFFTMLVSYFLARSNARREK